MSRRKVSTALLLNGRIDHEAASECQEGHIQYPTCDGPGSEQKILLRDYGREHNYATVVLFACFTRRKRTLRLFESKYILSQKYSQISNHCGQDLDILLRVFLSLAFAERGELGWDPTMRPVIRSDNSYAYRIDVDGETYETRETLSSSSADQLLGHATRVWRVRQLGSDGSESEDASFVLKDVWTEDDQEPEHLLLERLLNDVEEKYGAETRHKLASHLLTPVAHCFVRVNGEEDHTTNVMMRGYLPTYKEKYRVNVEHLGCDGDDGEDEDDGESGPTTEIGVDGLRRNGLKDPLHWYNPVRRIPRLKHYRMLFKEVAEPVYALRELEDVFTVLSDTAKGLFCSGLGSFCELTTS